MSGQRNVEERVTELSDSWQQQQESAETCERARRLGAGGQGGRSLSSQESPGSQWTRQTPLPPAHVTPPTICRTAQEAMATGQFG